MNLIFLFNYGIHLVNGKIISGLGCKCKFYPLIMANEYGSSQFKPFAYASPSTINAQKANGPRGMPLTTVDRVLLHMDFE